MGRSFRYFGSVWSKCVLVLVIVLIVLQIIHVNLLSQLHWKSSYHKNGKIQKYKIQQQNDVEDQLKNLISKVQYSSILDSSGEYKIVNNLLESQQYRESSKFSRKFNDITLTTQGTLNHIHHLAHLCSKWSGPISVTIFLPDSQISLAVLVTHTLHRCLPSVQRSISFHLVYPLSQPVNTDMKNLKPILRLQCNKTVEKMYSDMMQLFSDKNYDHHVLYPVNLLRNVARRNSWSEFIFLTDIDMYPNFSLYSEFLSFLESKKLFSMHSTNSELSYNTVYVVPAFEIDAGISPPYNKSELLTLLKMSDVKPFYSELCWKCQNRTDYEKWQELSLYSEFGIAYYVPWKDPWEPFYISHNKVPLYDERFKQYGFNRISQVCEVHIAGFSFAVLNNAFLLHQGFKEKRSFHENKDKDQQTNKLLYRQFKTELKQKYSETSRRCY